VKEFSSDSEFETTDFTDFHRLEEGAVFVSDFFFGPVRRRTVPGSDGASPSYGVCQATEKRVSCFSSF